MFPHVILAVFPWHCYNCNLNWGVIPNRNLKHSNSIQYYHSRINDAMIFFLHMYEPEHQFFLCTLGLMYCILHICIFFPYLFPIFKLLHKGTVHYCKRWVLNEKEIKILSSVLTCHELWCFEAVDPVFTERCSKTNMSQCKECLFSWSWTAVWSWS